MPRSMWRGAIQFGLVTIPLRLYLATESKGIGFHTLHAECLSRIQMQTWCPVHERTITRSETVKGYEIAPGQYVVITDEDLAAVPLKTVRAIEIERFVPASDLATLRFVKQAYYAEPEPLGRKAFTLLHGVLADQALTAIGKVVLTNREHLAALDPFGPTMLLSTLYWPDEIRSAGELDVPTADVALVKPAERALAEQLVAAMTESFDPAAYRDDYRDALLALIAAKAAGQPPMAAVEAPSSPVVDLMAALEASVAAARAARAAQPLRAVVAATADQAATLGEIPVTKRTRGGERRRKTA